MHFRARFAIHELKRLAFAALSPSKILNALKRREESYSATQLDDLWRDQGYILRNIDSVDEKFYEKNLKIQQLEHQVGRYLGMRKICDEIIESRISGDIVEFGTWRGLGLVLLSRCLSKDGMPRKLIGIDSFEGLPETSTVWQRGDFSDTSLDLATRNIERNKVPNSLHQTELIRGWFNDPSVKESLGRRCSEIALVHFDADLGSSTRQALALVEPYLTGRKAPLYFLFDDWGVHPDEVPDAFHDWLESARIRYNLRAEKLSSTRFTRYYRLVFG